MKCKTAIFLSVREKATRLPGKVLLKIAGKTVIEHLIDRLKQAELPDQIIMTTSTHPGDTVLSDIAKKCDIFCFRGSEGDKLDRYLQASNEYGIDFMAIVDGDDLLCDPVYIDRVIQRYVDTGADYIYPNGLPLGAASNGITRKALKKVCEIKTETDTEVWGGYFTETGLFKVECVEVQEKQLKRPEIRMTLDYEEDFQFFSKIFTELYSPGKIFTLEEVISLLDRKPEIAKLSEGVQKRWEDNLKKITKVSYKK